MRSSTGVAAWLRGGERAAAAATDLIECKGAGLLMAVRMELMVSAVGDAVCGVLLRELVVEPTFEPVRERAGAPKMGWGGNSVADGAAPLTPMLPKGLLLRAGEPGPDALALLALCALGVRPALKWWLNSTLPRMAGLGDAVCEPPAAIPPPIERDEPNVEEDASVRGAASWLSWLALAWRDGRRLPAWVEDGPNKGEEPVPKRLRGALPLAVAAAAAEAAATLSSLAAIAAAAAAAAS